MTPTATVATGGGGWQLYYRHPGGPTLPALPGVPGVDIKADGGYVVAPPSIHPGTRQPYRWVGGRPVNEMPPALRAAVARPAAPPAPAVTRPSGPVPVRGAGGISSPSALLAAHLRAVQQAPEGRRRATLYGAARGVARMVAAGALTEADARAALTDGRDRCPANPPRDPRRDRRRVHRRRSCRRMTTPTGPAADGAAILAQLHTTLTRYVILPSAEAAVAVALWIAATHAQDRVGVRAPPGHPRPREAMRQIPAAGHRGRHLP